MERFKALEKEMKMKAFSKEGLIAQSKLDPAEKAKRDIIDWISNTIDELARQIELTEAEAETLTTGKKKKGQGDRLNELEELNERRTWHTGRLEVVQRMLENGQLSVEQVESIQEDVNYFVEANGVSLRRRPGVFLAHGQEEDFDYDVGLYDELDLQEDEDFVHDFAQHDEFSNIDSASIADTNVDSVIAPPPKTPAKEEKERKSTPAGKSSKEVVDEQPTSPVSTRKQPSRKSTMEIKVAPPPAPKDVPPVPKVEAPAPKAAPLPTIRYAAAAAAAVAANTPPSVPGPTTTDASPAKAKTESILSPPVAAVEALSLSTDAERDTQQTNVRQHLMLFRGDADAAGPLTSTPTRSCALSCFCTVLVGRSFSVCRDVPFDASTCSTTRKRLSIPLCHQHAAWIRITSPACGVVARSVNFLGSQPCTCARYHGQSDAEFRGGQGHM